MAAFRYTLAAFGLAFSGAALWPIVAVAQNGAAADSGTDRASAKAVAPADLRYTALGDEMLRLNDRLASLERIIVQLVSQQDENQRSLALLEGELARLRDDAKAAEIVVAPQISQATVTGAGQPLTSPTQALPLLVDRFEQAGAFLERKEWANAELALTTFIANSPDDERIKEARYRLGLVYLEQGQAGQAASIFIELFETGPPDGLGAENLFALARALRALGNVDLAQVCSVYSEIDVAYGAELSGDQREELLDMRLAGACGQ